MADPPRFRRRMSDGQFLLLLLALAAAAGLVAGKVVRWIYDGGAAVMDEATQRWEEGARARLERRPVSADEGWFEADRFMTQAGCPLVAPPAFRREVRLTALWLEHRASTLEVQAAGFEEVGKGVEAERAQDDGRALEVAAAYVRRDLLGEES